MRGALRSILPFALLVALAVPGAAGAAERPSAKTLYYEGPAGRYLMDGEWLFRLDPSGQGLSSGWQRSVSTAGWTSIRVPHVWNLGDDSPASMIGGVGWYRKDFSLPDARRALEWAVRFESVNYRTRAWLNGQPIGSNTGAYLPFELQLRGLRRRGTNRLVIRVDSRRRPTDFPPARLNSSGRPTGGWWNYSGVQREVYLDRLDTVGWESVRVTPRLPCGRCPATVRAEVDLRNVTRGRRSVRVTGSFGSQRIDLGSRALPRGGARTFTTTFRVRRPRVWSPASPRLYDVRLRATSGGRTVGSYRLRTGIRSVRVSRSGRLLLNGRPTSFRGVGLHEDSKAQGFAVDNEFRERLVGEVQAVGATLMRTHYPMHPYTQELADRRGLLVWSEVPVYSLRTNDLARRRVRALAAREVRKNILVNASHPSVVVWSLANELSSRAGRVQAAYIRDATALAKRLDPSRPVGLAVAGYPTIGCQAAYRPLDVVGINDYFGWYPGPSGALFDRSKLSGYLDRVRRCYPRQALVISEFGAEANRPGPIEEKGTWAFQQDFVNYHLGVYDSKPWLSGAVYWALNEFRVTPFWEGGNPRPSPPLHQKGLLAYGTFARKPAWDDVRRGFTRVRQYR